VSGIPSDPSSSKRAPDANPVVSRQRVAVDNLEISVPSAAHDEARHATWRVSGTLRVRTRENA